MVQESLVARNQSLQLILLPQLLRIATHVSKPGWKRREIGCPLSIYIKDPQTNSAFRQKLDTATAKTPYLRRRRRRPRQKRPGRVQECEAKVHSPHRACCTIRKQFDLVASLVSAIMKPSGWAGFACSLELRFIVLHMKNENGIYKS